MEVDSDGFYTWVFRSNGNGGAIWKRDFQAHMRMSGQSEASGLLVGFSIDPALAGPLGESVPANKRGGPKPASWFELCVIMPEATSGSDPAAAKETDRTKSTQKGG